MKRIFILLLIIALLRAPSLWAAIAFDAASSCTDIVPGTTCTWSHTVTGSNPSLYVGTCLDTAGGTTVSGITFNGVALTQLGTLAEGGAIRGDLWFLVAPATGTHDIVVTKSAAVPNSATAVSLIGVHQTVPNGTPVNAQGSTDTPTVTATTASGETVIDAECNDGTGGTLVAGANQTERVQVTAGTEDRSGMSTQDGADGGVMSWTISASSWVINAVSVKPAATRKPVAPILLP